MAHRNWLPVLCLAMSTPACVPWWTGPFATWQPEGEGWVADDDYSDYHDFWRLDLAAFRVRLRTFGSIEGGLWLKCRSLMPGSMTVTAAVGESEVPVQYCRGQSDSGESRPAHDIQVAGADVVFLFQVGVDAYHVLEGDRVKFQFLLHPADQDTIVEDVVVTLQKRERDFRLVWLVGRR